MSSSAIFSRIIVFAAASAFSHQSTAQAVINESAVKQILHVSPTGNDANDGLQGGKPLATLQKAVDLSGLLPTKIILADGQYRQYLKIGKGTALLILEAKNPGMAVINGADPMTNWKPSATTGVLEHEWPHKWGLSQEFSWWGSTPLNRRREMIYVDDKRMKQRADAVGNALPLAELLAGEFTVDEAQAKIYARPSASQNFATAQVEMSIRGYDLNSYPWVQSYSRPLIEIRERSNIVIRGLVIKRAANYMKFGGALEIEGPDNAMSADDLPTNILIDRITVIENNAIGLELSNCRNVTVKNSIFNDNGERGAGMIQVGAERRKDPKAKVIAPRNYLWQDCQFNHNNWRMAGTWGDMNDSAGFKAFGQCADQVMFLRCQFNGNQANGYWQDYSGSNITLDQCMIENNTGTEAGGYGILNEMTRGPFTVRNCVIRNNTNAGIISSGSPNVIIESNIIHSNNFVPRKPNNYFCQELRVNSDTHRDGGDFEFSLQGWILKGNTLASLGGEIGGFAVVGQILEASGPNFPSGLTPQAEFAKYVTSDHNTWSKNTNDAHGDRYLFSLTATDKIPDINLATWQAQSNAHGKQDIHSKFIYPLDLTSVKDPTLQKK